MGSTAIHAFAGSIRIDCDGSTACIHFRAPKETAKGIKYAFIHLIFSWDFNNNAFNFFFNFRSQH